MWCDFKWALSFVPRLFLSTHTIAIRGDSFRNVHRSKWEIIIAPNSIFSQNDNKRTQYKFNHDTCKCACLSHSTHGPLNLRIISSYGWWAAECAHQQFPRGLRIAAHSAGGFSLRRVSTPFLSCDRAYKPRTKTRDAAVWFSISRRTHVRTYKLERTNVADERYRVLVIYEILF